MTANDNDDAAIGRTVPTPEMPAALVTGGGHRIGRAIALSLARAGWNVAVHYRDAAAEAQSVVEEIEAMGRRATRLPADLGQEHEAQALVPAALGALGPLGCLVNNASTFEYDNVETATRESWDAHIEPNLRAPFVLTQAFARQVPDNPGTPAAVVNILDQRVWNLTPHFVSYTVSKAGLWALTRTMALALAPRIRVNAIGPGPTLRSAQQSEAQFEKQWTRMPLGRGTTPQEIADTVQFILASPSMTGQMLALDGGQHLAWEQTDRTDTATD